MQLIAFRDGDRDRLGVVVDGRAVPAAVLGGPDTPDGLLADVPRALAAIREGLAAHRPARDAAALDSVSLLAPIPRPGKVVAIGLNYRAHAEELGAQPPGQPLIFAKLPTAVVGHGAEVRWDPGLTGQVDYEAELAVVIGRTTRRVAERDALDHVLGYTCGNDVSARDLQFGDRQWVRGKSLDTFCPLGPVLVTADGVPDPQALRLRCLVNGEELQASTTADMIFGVAELIAYCSRAFTLEPGDVIMTGTPPGVGFYRQPQRFLRDGDEVAIEIDGIGRLVNRCREEPADSDDTAGLVHRIRGP